MRGGNGGRGGDRCAKKGRTRLKGTWGGEVNWEIGKECEINRALLPSWHLSTNTITNTTKTTTMTTTTKTSLYQYKTYKEHTN